LIGRTCPHHHHQHMVRFGDGQYPAPARQRSTILNFLDNHSNSSQFALHRPNHWHLFPTSFQQYHTIPYHTMTNAVFDIKSHLLTSIKDLHDLIHLAATSPLERAIYEQALAQEVAALDRFNNKNEDKKKGEEEKEEETGTGYNDMVVISSAYPTTNKHAVPVTDSSSSDDSQHTTVMSSSDEDDSSFETNDDLAPTALPPSPPHGLAREQVAV
jgi:hypothetical protein